MPEKRSAFSIRRVVKALRPNLIIKSASGAQAIWTFLPRNSKTSSRIHRFYRHRVWRDAQFAEWLVLVLGVILWLPVTLLFIALCTRRCGRRVKKSIGKGIVRQCLEQFHLAATMAVPPPWYYIFEFHDDDKRNRAAEYLYRFETKRGIYDFLRLTLPTAPTWKVLSDKAEFSVHCQRHNLVAVEVKGTAIDEVILRADGTKGLPDGDLFLKPIQGAGGRGAERWCLQVGGKYSGPLQDVKTTHELIEHLKELSRIEPYVIRKLVHHHKTIVNLSAGALSTVRVLTILNEDGHAEVTNAVLRMAVDQNSVVDNFHAGGVAATVGVESGILGIASDMGLQANSKWWSCHPTTGGQIEGVILPFWCETLELCRLAHDTLNGYAVVGWDVAILDDGPFLIEGNKSPDLDIVQRIGCEPLGDSRFGDLLLFHIERANAMRKGSTQESSQQMKPGSKPDEFFEEAEG